MTKTLGDITKSTFLKGVDNNRVHNDVPVAPRTGTIVFDADLVASNAFNVDINGTAMDEVTFDTDHDNTMDLIVAALEAMDEVESASLPDSAGDNRTIEIVPTDQTKDVAITNAVVTGGASQAGVTTSTASNLVYGGQPVKLQADGTAVALEDGDAYSQAVGQAVHNANPNTQVTVALYAVSVIWAVSAAEQDAGPVSYKSYNTTEDRSVYQAEATAANVSGWALDSASAADELIRVAVRG